MTWLKRSTDWIKENPGKGTMYKMDDKTPLFIPIDKKQRTYHKGSKRKQVFDIGVYVIKCEIEKSVYVGQSINIGSRLRSHKLLIMAPKCDKRVYNLMRIHKNKHGIEAFEFVTFKSFETITPEDLTNKENEAMMYFIQQGYKLYNLKIEGFNMYCPPALLSIMNKLINSISANPSLIDNVHAIT